MGWQQRQEDPIFATLPSADRPLPCPIQDRLLLDAVSSSGSSDSGSIVQLPKVASLLEMAEWVEKWKVLFLQNNTSPATTSATTSTTTNIVKQK